MELTLASPQQRLTQGEQVTIEIQGLGQRPQGTYIVGWIVDPHGAITPAGDTIFVDGGERVYSVFDAAQQAPPRASFDVRAASAPVTVTAEVRYSSQRVQPAAADRAFAGAEPVATARAPIPAGEPVPNAAPATGTPATPALGGSGSGAAGNATVGNAAAAPGPAQVEVTMHRAAVDKSASQALWTMIRQSTNALSFRRYQLFMDQLLSQQPQNGLYLPHIPAGGPAVMPGDIARKLLPWRMPFPGVEPYRQLKAATEVFVMLNCGVPFDQFMKPQGSQNPFMSPTQQWDPNFIVQDALHDESRRYYRQVTSADIYNAWQALLAQGQRAEGDLDSTMPNQIQTVLYLALVRANLPDVPVTNMGLDLSPEAQSELNTGAVNVMGIMQEKLNNPPFLDLFWSYWMEECGLVQTMNAISWRFQNRRGPGDRDPLAGLELDPLRPLGTLLWSYIQDEQHRLTVARRAYEYDHEFGLPLLGRAVPEIASADSRPRFIEALHNLLHVCSAFYKEDDDTTIVADGFPVLNALKEVHLQLAAGASNQYGDLPWTARLEMLMQQWLLARPEFREFLPRRIMIDFPEAWMHSVESMKTLQGWNSASTLHFRDMAVFGEQILLSIRYESWPSIIESQHAANWARYWRSELQGYMYAYRAATGVDVTQGVDATPPALLLRERMRQALPEDGRTRYALPQDGRGRLERPRPVAQLPMATRLEETGY